MKAAEAVANARVAARAVKETKHCIADTIRRTIDLLPSCVQANGIGGS